MYFSQKTVTVQGGYGALFAVRVQIFVSITRVAVQVVSKPVNYHGTELLLGALAQCRGTSCLEARNLSRYRKFNCEQMRVSGCNNHYKIVLGAGAKQKV